MKKVVLVLVVLLLIACGKKVTNNTVVNELPEVPEVTDEQTDINNLVSQENEYRNLLGQTTLTNGLTCSVQQIASGQKISNSSPVSGTVISLTGTRYTFLLNKEINQPNSSGSVVNALLPEALRPSYVGLNYLIRCEGFLVVRETGYYGFELNSDDGSILTVDGTQVVNNDGNHGMTLKKGFKFLRRGVRSFKLEYAQTGSGNFGLILTSSGNIIPTNYFYF
jgi:hypothetical protein